MSDVSGEYAALPATIPARMLNEFVYCPRLFYLEWVDGRWTPNADTAQGDAEHARNDRRRGKMPKPDDDSSGSTSQVHICDEDLGVTAVLDVVRHDGVWHLPVERKKGSGPRDNGMWEADRIQALCQAVLLRRAGYQVDAVEVEYIASGRRVRQELDEACEQEVRSVAQAAREVAESIIPPLPLVNDARCPRCSLVGLCLPDETNQLLERTQSQARRLVAPNRPTQPVYVSHQGATVKVHQRRLRVEFQGDLLQEVRLIDVAHLCVIGNVQVTTQALNTIWRQGGVVVWFNYGGWFSGWAQGPWGKHVELRRRQVISHVQGVKISRQMIAGKIHNQRVVMRRNAKLTVPKTVLTALRQAERDAAAATSLPQLLGAEGGAARLYFQHFHKLFSKSEGFAAEFQSNGRQRRPAPDPVNAVLGFCYGLLTKDVVASLVGVGLDPYLGVLHRSRYGRPALALDIAEEFRALVAESVCLNVFNNGELAERHFRRHPTGVMLTADGRKVVIGAFERRMAGELTHPVFGYRVSYRRVIDLQVRMLASVMLGELPEYIPVMTR